MLDSSMKKEYKKFNVGLKSIFKIHNNEIEFHFTISFYSQILD